MVDSDVKILAVVKRRVEPCNSEGFCKLSLLHSSQKTALYQENVTD